MSALGVITLVSWGIRLAAATQNVTLSTLGRVGDTGAAYSFTSNVTFPMEPHPNRCDGPFKFKEHHLHVYHIQSKDATLGISNKNAGSALGTVAFIFGGQTTSLPRGLILYYKSGVIEMKYLSVKHYGDYLQCYKKGKEYTCHCPKEHKGACNHEKPGRQASNHSDGHVWYSFPAAGGGDCAMHPCKYWAYEKYSPKRGCKTITVSGRCMLDKLMAAAHCSDDCKHCGLYSSETCRGNLSESHCPHQCVKCRTCMMKLADHKADAIWDEAIWKGGCKPLERSSQAMVVV